MPDIPKKLNRENIIFERRRFVRIDGTFVVSYSEITTAQPKSDLTQTRNISLGGILFTTDRIFSVGTILKVRIRLPEAPDYINVKVKVVDSKPRSKAILYDTRAKFIDIKEEDRDLIRKIVEFNLQKRKVK